MKNKIMSFGIVFLVFFLFQSGAEAKTLALACPDLPTCLQSVSTLTGDQYLLSGEVKMQKEFETSGLELTKENADLLVTNILASNALARVSIAPHIYQIYRENDAKGLGLPRFFGSFSEDPALPETADLVTFIYKAKHPESVRNAENVIRTYANMGARIYGDSNSGTLFITSRSNDIRLLLPIFRKLDVPDSADTQRKIKEHILLRRIEAAHPAPIVATPPSPPHS